MPPHNQPQMNVPANLAKLPPGELKLRMAALSARLKRPLLRSEVNVFYKEHDMEVEKTREAWANTLNYWFEHGINFEGEKNMIAVRTYFLNAVAMEREQRWKLEKEENSKIIPELAGLFTLKTTNTR